MDAAAGWMTATLGPHAGFIVAAYAVTAATVVVLAVWIAVERRAVTRQLRRLDAEGIRRRSARSKEER
jgi:heme exporter protein D